MTCTLQMHRLVWFPPPSPSPPACMCALCCSEVVRITYSKVCVVLELVGCDLGPFPLSCLSRPPKRPGGGGWGVRIKLSRGSGSLPSDPSPLLPLPKVCWGMIWGYDRQQLRVTHGSLDLFQLTKCHGLIWDLVHDIITSWWHGWHYWLESGMHNGML